LVVGPPIPPILKISRGFKTAVEVVCRECEVYIRYGSGFLEPDEGVAMADELIGIGCDIIHGAGGATGSASVLHAARQGVHVIGADIDVLKNFFFYYFLFFLMWRI